MEIRVPLPWGGEFYYRREPRKPMDKDKFYAVCYLLAGALVVTLILGFFSIAAGR